MGVFHKLKTWLSCKTSGRMEEYKSYKKSLENKITDINRYTKYLSDATQKFENAKISFGVDSRQYADAKYEMHRWQQSLDEAKLVVNFIRPNLQEDIDYRNMQCSTFANNLQEVLSTNFDLRFHGTPIYFAEQIIKTGKISSTADRYDGYIKSSDGEGEISVADRDSIDRTINYFSDIVSYQQDLPSGCIFALLPKNKDDANTDRSTMHSVDFRKNPEQLFGIFTTPENIEQVKSWMSRDGFNPDLVYTFEEFLQAVKVKSNIIDEKAKFDKLIEAPDNAKEFSNMIPQINNTRDIQPENQEMMH